ncbi:BBSome complex assembly protein BBS10 [Halichoeres trimaculatus]|uniref:BBSome complex assembly protein BBS10 n=1 Tax=Halichoeres trimaculatus TaxID=147232 RepID=UPI003D9E721D
MLPEESLHLEHLLQTASVLESVVRRSFGPEGGQVLFTRDTGQAVLSRSGTRILTALRLEHPLARMIVECVTRHSAVTGDGSKTFILLLASLLREIHTAACKVPHVSHIYKSREAAVASAARHLAKKLLTFALEELDGIIAMGVVPYGSCLQREDFTATRHPETNIPCIQKLLASFYHSRVGHTHCDFFSHLTTELLNNWNPKKEHPSLSLNLLNDNMSALLTPVSGFPNSCSRLIEGQVIHRDFSTPCPPCDQQPLKAVVLTGFLQPGLLCAGEVLELGCGDPRVDGKSREERSIVQFSALAERSLECAISHLQSLGVSVVLSAAKQSAAALASAAQVGICMVECVSEDELSLFAHLSGASPVTDCLIVGPNNIAELNFCQPILLGAHRFVHVAFCDSHKRLGVNPCGLIIYGVGEGQTDQYVHAIHDAIHMLLSTWEPIGMTATTASKQTFDINRSSHAQSQIPKVPPCRQGLVEPGCIVPAAGTFEFLLHHALSQHGHTSLFFSYTHLDTSVSQLLANALLSVPRHIYSHSPRHFLQVQATLLSLVNKQSHNKFLKQNLGESMSYRPCCRETEMPLKDFMFDFGLESVPCKYQLLLAVLQCLSSLLQIDSILHIHTALRTQTQGLSNISWECTKDEAEECDCIVSH